MLTTPQTTERPSSRSGSKLESGDSEKRAGSPDKGISEKGAGRENHNGIMSDELNQPGEGNANHNIDKSDTEDDDDEQDEVSSFIAFLLIFTSQKWIKANSFTVFCILQLNGGRYRKFCYKDLI